MPPPSRRRRYALVAEANTNPEREMPAQLIQEHPPRQLSPQLEPVPEPARLFGLTVLAFVFHVPDQQCDALLSVCRSCREPWPCDQVRLAYRNREAF